MSTLSVNEELNVHQHLKSRKWNVLIVWSLNDRDNIKLHDRLYSEDLRQLKPLLNGINIPWELRWVMKYLLCSLSSSSPWLGGKFQRLCKKKNTTQGGRSRHQLSKTESLLAKKQIFDVQNPMGMDTNELWTDQHINIRLINELCRNAAW